MKVNNYVVDWKHNNQCKNAELQSSSTVCFISVVEDKQKVGKASGTAKMSQNDNYCRETGRKVSLKRALKELGATKAERTQFWESYRKMSPTPKWGN